jgi:hypothetical protein
MIRRPGSIHAQKDCHVTTRKKQRAAERSNDVYGRNEKGEEYENCKGYKIGKWFL